MPNRQAGYINPELRKALSKRFGSDKTEPLLRSLSLFKAETNFPDKQAAFPSEIAVLHNLIVRGLPTLTPILVEEALTKLHFTEKTEEYGSIKFALTLKGQKALDEFYSAFHVGDNRLQINRSNFPNDHLLGSNFERAFYYEAANGHFHIQQLLEPQVTFERIHQNFNPSIGGFHAQQVDFAFPVPYRQTEIKNGITKTGFNGFIIEVDGSNYHCTLDQILLDERRDEAAKLNTWRTLRLKTNEQATNILEKLNQQEYVKRVKEHCQKSLVDNHWLDVLQFALTPFAVARVQKIVLEAIISGVLNLNASEWSIIVIEQDVPCARLAIDGLQLFLDSLYGLSGRPQPPRIKLLKVFVSKDFASAKLHDGENIIAGGYDGSHSDLLIDVSMLRRTGLEKHPSYSSNYAILRSARWFEYDRKFIFAPFIVYQGLFEKEGKTLIPEHHSHLQFFLQNLFRKATFRPGQLPILQRALRGQTVIGLLPTGGGKSLTYQLAALLQPGIALVIDPIRSLMKDQVDSLRRLGVDACQLINSTLKTQQRKLALHDLEKGKVLFSFVSPERLLLDEFREVANRMANEKNAFSYCVIDEAHCVSEWGHDFRTAYLALGMNAVAHCKPFEKEKNIPLLGLTATASFDVLSDVERELLITDAEAVVRFENTVREEIQYQVIDVPVQFEKDDRFSIQIGEQPFKPLPIKGNAKETVAKAKLSALTKILKELPGTFAKWNNDSEIRVMLSHAWQSLFDIETKSSYNDEVENYINSRFGKISYPDYIPEKFFGENGGLVFAPHRKWVFGVTEKFEPSRYSDDAINEAGQIIHRRRDIIRDANNRPIPLPPSSRRSIADNLTEAGFLEAIPEMDFTEDADLSHYVGTFMGASEEAADTTERIDRDSFRNQDFFLENRLKLLVATKAFGMGIDKPNIRFTAHFNIPSSPEGFVQESGRAGRDGQLSLSFILLNRQKLYGFGNWQIRWIKANRGVGVPISLNEKWFEEGDFKNLLQQLGLSYDLMMNAEAVRSLHVDRDILEFFHFNSFKGREKEKLMVKQLFEQITFPSYEHHRDWAETVNEDLQCRISLNYWTGIRNGVAQHRLYITNEEEKIGLGYIDLTTWNSAFLPEGALEIHQAIKSTIQKELGTNPNLPSFLLGYNKQNANLSQAGILKRLQNETEDDFVVEVGFANRFIDEEIYQNAVVAHVQNNIPSLQNIPNDQILNALTKGDDFQDFCERLPGMTYENVQQVLGLGRFERLREFYHARRLKAETDKAIFRLNCIGIVDDFTVDYRKKMYYLTIKRKQPEAYVEALYKYIQRYYSDERAKSEIKKLRSVKLKNDNQPVSLENIELESPDLGVILPECVNFLIDFTYEEIAKKRFSAIGDMLDACEEFLSKKSEQQGNFALKEWLFLYFNSKYARKGYEAKLADFSKPNHYSLLDESDGGKDELDFTRIISYLELMALDKSGGETDNIKHLRGATTRLLRDQPGNNSLKLLKAFTYFILGFDSETLFKEAQEACVAGFQNYLSDDHAKLAEQVEKFKEKVLQYTPNKGRKKVRDFLDNLLNVLLLEHHSNWLKEFNHQFLNGFYHEPTRNIAGIAKTVEQA